MKKEIMISANGAETKSTYELNKACIDKVKKPIVALSIIYSRILEEKISVKQTLLLLNAQIAFVFTIFPMDFSLIIRALCIVWFATAVAQCKRSGLKTSDEPY
jgi:hypothetical protein